MASGYFKQVLLALDQLANAALGGWADESISSRAWRNRERGGWAHIYRGINALFFWQSNHCRGAFEAELARRHLPPEFRRAEP